MPPPFAIRIIKESNPQMSAVLVAMLVFRLLNRSASTLTAPTISFHDRWLFPPSRVLDRLFGPWFGKNVYVLCRKRLKQKAATR